MTYILNSMDKWSIAGYFNQTVLEALIGKDYGVSRIGYLYPICHEVIGIHVWFYWPDLNTPNASCISGHRHRRLFKLAAQFHFFGKWSQISERDRIIRMDLWGIHYGSRRG